uniref:hypothetical protein n=1 Tax=Thaumasiovibrio occultus TaxID=1891184 RepID=UPI000B34D2EF|nr:hypothetical protein [Thaumasiovibrio occultus]
MGLKLFSRESSKTSKASIAILADGVYVANGHTPESSAFRWAFRAATWSSPLDTPLKEAVKEAGIEGLSVQLVFGQGQYQSLQLDMPEVPREEWPTALPFLVKDLVNDSPTNLAVDGTKHLQSNKIQAYIVRKERLRQILAACESANVTVAGVTVEEHVLGHLVAKEGSEMLFYRQGEAPFIAAAFHQQTHCFQRQLRSIQPPLSGDNVNALVLESLALEMQRSLDYLSAQLKGSPARQVSICCDREQDQQIAEQLEQRLGIKAVPLFADLGLPMGALIAAAGCMPSQLDLYPEDMRPRREWLSLNTMVGCWLLCSVGLIAGWAWLQQVQQDETAQLSQLEIQRSQLQTQITDLSELLASREPSEFKQRYAARLEQNIADTELSMNALVTHDKSLAVGYAGVMADLAQIYRPEISIQRIAIKGEQMDISGYTANAEDVPIWVQDFAGQPHLYERGFRQLNIQRDEDDRLAFSLQTHNAQHSVSR